MAKLTRKSYQRKAMVVGATAFAGIALMATGFAAWVISSSATKNVQGNVNVGVVSDKSIKLTVNPITDKFSFDSKRDDKTGRVRCDGKNWENLSITVSGEYTNPDMVNKFNIALRMGTVASEDADPVFDTKAETRFTNAAAEPNKYIVLPACFGPAGVDFNTTGETGGEGKTLTVASDKSKATFSYTISFAWGDHFKDTLGTKENLNPSEFYDSTTGTTNYGGDAYKEDLNKFFKALTNKDAASPEEITAGYSSLNFVVVVTAHTSGAATPAA